MAADRDDNPGVLGNLPRSRPGQRSAKRSTGSAARKPRTTKAAPSTSAKPSTRTAPKRRTTTQATPPRPRPAPAARKEATDPLGQAVELAGKVAAVGLKTAAGIVKRLPRP